MNSSFQAMAEKAADDPFYVASTLRQFAASAELTDPQLAAHLNCSLEALTMIRLCRLPHPGDQFGPDVQRIAERFAADPVRLAAAIRHAQVLATLQRSDPANQEAGYLLAAREADTDQDDP